MVTERFLQARVCLSTSGCSSSVPSMQITAYAMGRRVWERSKTDRRIRPIVRMGLIVATFELRIATEMARASIASVIGATIIGCVPPAIIDYHPSQFEIETDHIR